jgi:hypothetical protein
MRAGKGSFLGGKLKLALKKISAGRRPVRAIQAHPFFEVSGRWPGESLRIQWDQVGLVLVDALVVG